MFHWFTPFFENFIDCSEFCIQLRVWVTFQIVLPYCSNVTHFSQFWWCNASLVHMLWFCYVLTCNVATHRSSSLTMFDGVLNKLWHCALVGPQISNCFEEIVNASRFPPRSGLRLENFQTQRCSLTKFNIFEHIWKTHILMEMLKMLIYQCFYSMFSHAKFHHWRLHM